MKKNTYILAIIFFLTNYSFASNISDTIEKTTLFDEILNGKIKTISEKWNYNDGKTDSMFYFFNELGLLTTYEHSLFAFDYKKAIYTYNLDNQILKIYYYGQKKKKPDSTEFFYENGNLIKHITKFPASKRYYFDYDITHYKYDENRNLIEKKKLRKYKDLKKETFLNHYKYQYDSIGNNIIEEELKADGKVFERKENKYSNQKLVETFTWMEFEGEDLYLKDIYEYNENSTLKSHTHIVYDYGSTDDEVAKFTTYYSYEYDINGRLIEDTETTSQEQLIQKYSNFDEKGNWTQKTIISDEKYNLSKKAKIVVRKIEYYE